MCVRIYIVIVAISGTIRQIDSEDNSGNVDRDSLKNLYGNALNAIKGLRVGSTSTLTHTNLHKNRGLPDANRGILTTLDNVGGLGLEYDHRLVGLYV